MSYSATITLTSGTANANVNNFTIDVYDGGGLRATLVTGVTRTALTSGYTVSGILNTDTKITVTSNALCVNSVDYFLPGATPTPTPSPVVSYNSISVAAGSAGGTGTACTSAQVSSWTSAVFHPTDTILVDGHTYFTHTGNPYLGGMGYFSDGIVVGRISNAGYFTEETICQ